jgi:hypothetical protein
MSPRKLLSLSAFSAVLLGACTSGGESLNVVTPQNGQIYYFRGYARVDTDYLDRYACTDRRLLLKCTCTSKLARYCDCRC